MSRSNAADPARQFELTPRQEEVVRLLARGLTNAEIADRLGLTLDGVKWHVREILGRYGVESREQAVEAWRSERKAGRRLRTFGAGLWAHAAVRWTGAVAVAGAGAAMAAGIVLPAEDTPPRQSAAAVTPTPTPDDPATNEGLTLRIEKVTVDDTRTVLEFSLEGRPELGRFASPAFSPVPTDLQLTDQDGNEYSRRQMGGEEGRPRFMRVVFAPVPAGTTALHLRVGNARFVAPAFEVPEGQRPPDPSASIEGPWLATITEFPRDPVAHVAVDTAPRPFGPGSIVLDEVLVTGQGVVVRAHVLDLPPTMGHAYLHPRPSLVSASGETVSQIAGRWGEGANEDRMEFTFAPVSGPVVLTITGVAGFTLSEEDIEANITAQGMLADQAEAYRQRMRDLIGTSKAAGRAFEGTSPATWSFTLP